MKPAQSKTAAAAVVEVTDEGLQEEIAYLAKRHRVSPGVVREIVRSLGSSERSAVEREITRGKARR